jgi:N-methylhydantoinase B
LVSKVTDIRIAQGQRVRLETPGGGGYGDPLTRDPVRVANDVKLGYVTRASARKDYNVVIGHDGSVDTEATAGLRSGAGR